MEPRISVITLGVDDLDRAARFYEDMGLERNGRITEGVAFFQMGGLILALWPREELAEDAGIKERTRGFSGVALAYNTRSEAEVGLILERAERAGGSVVKTAQRAFWGGMQGYFADTEGNLWEVAHNPDFPIDEEGRISLPE
ncbi:VOC family protein [Chelativorans salis]|uniref:VOC family protein n=1 Tax=Chelativorans salis TaxID=2978478 RepID=A0ABT2LMM7_9HYPH|nr:VOC family protein [Chelativorans sp. EGI FJ00035]MCT7375821.1 VOC family protein [Chelativorans sp. EGI FJ00035]